MPITSKARRASPPNPSGSLAPDAITMLIDDHKKVSELFAQYEASRSAAKKQVLVENICRELSVHATLEEEIFYPAVKAALKDNKLVPEALVEHATVKEFIAKVDGRLPEGEMFDAQVQVMGEYVKHHVKEEQTELFPKARKTSLDMSELGQRMLERKQELLADPESVPKAPTAVADLPDEQTA